MTQAFTFSAFAIGGTCKEALWVKPGHRVLHRRVKEGDEWIDAPVREFPDDPTGIALIYVSEKGDG